MTAPMIEVQRLRKLYGSFEAVKDLSFSVRRGEIVGFLGPNGAGKSTTLRILAGFLGPSAGTVKIAGHDVVSASLEARASLGYMPEACPLYPEMRVSEYLRFRAELKGVSRADRGAHVELAVTRAGLSGMEAVLIGHLSKGFRQRVGLADALVAKPPLLILDEPTAGLDPNQIREVRALIESLREEHTILISTHILSEVEAMCTRGIVIAHGELVAEGTLAELVSMRRATGLRVRLGSDAAAARRIAQAQPGVRAVRVERHGEDVSEATLHVGYEEGSEGSEVTSALIKALAVADHRILSATPESSLEEVFAELTREKRQG